MHPALVPATFMLLTMKTIGENQTPSCASRGASHGVATLKARKGAFDALKKRSGALLICTVFPHILGPFGGGGGRKTEFCGQEFYGHPGFSESLKE